MKQLEDDFGPISIPVYTHRYSIVGSWNSYSFKDMVYDKEDDFYEATLRIGTTGRETFQFVRDHDWSQVVHPEETALSTTPIEGPDNNGDRKYFVLSGSYMDVVKVRLHIKDAAIVMVTESQTKGQTIWRNREGQQLQEVKAIK